MKTTRLIAGLTTAGLLGLAPVALTATPASAVVATTTTLVTQKTVADYGDNLGIYLDGEVKAADGTFVSGSASLQILTAANPVWTQIAVDESASFLYFGDVIAQSNAQYKVVFSDPTGAYAPSESAPVSVAVTRTIAVKNLKGASAKVRITVKPDFAKKKFKILTAKKAKGQYKLAAKVKTDSKGKAVYTFRGTRSIYYVRLVVPGDANFAKTVTQGSIS